MIYRGGSVVTVDGHGTVAGGGSGTDSLGAAPTVIPGVVFEGSGRVCCTHCRPLMVACCSNSTPLGRSLQSAVPAHGGAIAVSGAIAVDGMLYIGSGYAVGNGASAGNLLLAFEVPRAR